MNNLLIILLFFYYNYMVATNDTNNHSNMLELTANFQSRTAWLNQPLWVEITLKNTGKIPVLINSRFEMGYQLSISRELYAEMLDEAAPQIAAHSPAKINREDPIATDYSLLQSGKSITKKIDFFHYYHPRKPGRYRITIFYQADEACKKTPPEVYKGIISTKPVTIEVLAGKLPHQNE